MYPPAERGSVVDDYHGTRVPDPYRWMEDIDSPQTRAWVSAEGQLTERYLNGIPAREAIRKRVADLYDFERFGVPFHEGGRYFYTRNSGMQDQSVLYVTSSLDAPAMVALDPNALSTNGSRIVTGYVASRDGRLLAYGVSESGSDWTDWHVRDLDSGHDFPDVLRFTKYYSPQFSEDGKALYYSAFPAPAAGQELATQDLDNALYYHALGTPTSADRKLLQRPADRDWQYLPHVTSDGRWLVVMAGQGEVGDRGRENVYLIDTAKDGQVTAITEGFDAAYLYVGSDAGSLYFLTTLDAPNGRIIAVDPAQPARSHWKTVIPAESDAIAITETSVTLVDHQLIVRRLHDAHTRVTSYGLDGSLRRELTLPGLGTARGFEGRPEFRETFYSFTDLITPPTIYRVDLETGQHSVFRAPHVSFDSTAFEQRQVFYHGKDGIRIPMMLAYRKGLKLDGTNPVLLYGYGGFGIPSVPTFAPARIAWLEMGGVFALANIRGGGEYGEAWHRQGTRAHKQVVFDDFIAAGEWLIAQHYTRTSRLAIQGGSNGGLLVGACVTQRPDLYGAAIAQVGVMDMLRFDRFGQGAGWAGDYGSPSDPEDFKALRAYSPVHNVHAGKHYPPTLIVTGDHDTRVMPMHSFKFAAAMQAAQAGPAPVLLYLESSSGHGGGATVRQAIEQNGDIFAFLVKNLDLKPFAVTPQSPRKHAPGKSRSGAP
jgi:prolyl oligopeptidase